MKTHRHPLSPTWKSLLRLGWLLGLVLTAWFSLLPGDRVGPLPGSDKVWHGSSYLALALPVCLLFRRPVQRWRVAALLVLFGAALEVGQLFVPRRSFEWGDMAANTSGVLLGMLLSYFLWRILPAPEPPRGPEPLHVTEPLHRPQLQILRVPRAPKTATKPKRRP